MPFYPDLSCRERYLISAFAFGGSTGNRPLLGLTTKQGFVRDILLSITTAMVGTTSVPEIRVGTAASDNSYARFLLGTTATAGYGTGAFRARTLCQSAQGRTGSKATQLNDFAHHIALEGNDGSGTVATAADANGFVYMPADTTFFITGVAGVGGTPAGTADVYVDVDWWL
jgi:hypothetical protein